MVMFSVTEYMFSDLCTQISKGFEVMPDCKLFIELCTLDFERWISGGECDRSSFTDVLKKIQ